MLAAVLGSFLLAKVPVSLSTVGRVSVVAAEVGRRSGLQVEVARAIPDHALIVALNDADPDEALEKIAWSVHGLVEIRNGVRWIVPDTVGISRAKARFREWKIERNQKIVAALLANRSRQESGKRALVKILALLPPSQWVDEPMFTMPFATSPKVMERPLSAEALQIYQRDLDVFRTGKDLSTARLGKVVLSILEPNRPRVKTAILQGWADRGTRMSADARADIPIVLDLTPLQPAAEVDAKLAQSVGDREPLRWSPETQDLIGQIRSQKAAIDPESALGRACRDPLRFDPQRVGVGDVYFQVAAKTGRSVVVNASDEDLFAPLHPTPTNLLTALKRVWTPFAEADQRWILDRPPVPVPDWGWQVNRSAFARFLAQAQAPGTDRVVTHGEFYRHAGRPPIWSALGFWIYWVIQEHPVDLMMNPGFQTYSMLTPTIRDGLARGTRIPLAALPDEARAAFWNGLSWQHLHPPEKGPRVNRELPMSEIFPDGLPNGLVTAFEGYVPLLRVIRRNPSETIIQSANQLGRDKTPWYRLEPMWERSVTLRVDFEGGWYWECGMQRSPQSTGRIVSSLLELPPAHQQAIRQGAEKKGKP